MNMQTFDVGALARKVRLLPDTLKSLYTHEDGDIYFDNLQIKYNLTDSQIHAIVRITSQTLLGVLQIQKFISNLIDFAQLKEGDARQIAQDINEQIFQPVREDLLHVHGISEPGKHVETANEAAQTVEHTPEYPTAQVEAPQPVQVTDEAAKQKREELLARLKAAQDTPIHMQPERPPQEPEAPRAVTTAWNGKTIDLSKIPPRRQLNGNGQKNGEVEIRTVQLKKGPDGYWYEV